MNKYSRSLAVLVVAFAAIPFAAAAGPDFDAAQALRDALSGARGVSDAAGSAAVAEPSVWVSLSESDLSALKTAGLGFPAERGAGAALFEIPRKALPRLSAFMHERFHRCGGFFSYGSRRDAEAGLSVAKRVAAEADYTIDQKAWAAPLMDRVREDELRATIEKMASFPTRYYEDSAGAEAALWLQGRWAALAKGFAGASVELIRQPDNPQPSVVLTIPGSEKPDEIVVLGGHLDSINVEEGSSGRSPGADDNASGIAVLTETARVLLESGARPRRTIQFMGYSAEEVGLVGSRYIAERYASQGKKVVGVIQFDMTNFKGSADDIYLIGDNVDPALTSFLGKLVDSYVGVRWSTMRCGYACSDHASWTRSGYPASGAFESSFEEMNQQIHSSRDTLENSGGDAKHSVVFAKLALAFAAELAKASPGIGTLSAGR